MIFGKEEAYWKERTAFNTANEIQQQPDTWEKTLKQYVSIKEEVTKFVETVTKQPDFDIIFTGAGASEFVGNALYHALNKRYDHKVKSYGSTDIVPVPENYLSAEKPTLLISFARSGNSPESVGAVDVANTVCKNVKHLFITCNKDGELAKIATKNNNCYSIILTPETNDLSFAMTSSFSSMYLMAYTILTYGEEIKKAEDLAAAVRKELADYDFFTNVINTYDFKRIAYLGIASLKGMSQECALKMCELTQGKIMTVYDGLMGFRHGPKSIVDDDTLTVMLFSEDPYTRQYEMDLLKEMSVQRKGDKIMCLTSIDDPEVKKLCDFYYHVDVKESQNAAMLAMAYVVCAQMIALNKSQSMGITTDDPCPTGEVNRVVKGVNIYPYKK